MDSQAVVLELGRLAIHIIQYMDIFVTEENPRLLDDQFIELYPALELQTTCNSGAYWGDGDGRAEATDYGRLQFALESKARFGKQYNNTRPRAEEWEKAMGQLRVRNREAIRLFLVYHHDLRTYGVSFPEEDAVYLESLGFEVGGTARMLRRRGAKLPYRHLDFLEWVDFYMQLAAQRPEQ